MKLSTAAALTADLTKRSQFFSRQIVPLTPGMIATIRLLGCTDNSDIGARLRAEQTVFAQLGTKLWRHTKPVFRAIGG
jgi:hypothetical protein